MRSRFDEQLTLLHTEMIRMGALCEQAIAMGSEALTQGDVTQAKQVKSLDCEIDQMERDIESLCMKMLLQQQPVARDLRRISAALKMITDMERIGDQAEDIAEIVVMLNGRTADENVDIKEMAKATIKMLTDCIDAYVKTDLALAQQVIAEDDVVDNYFDLVKGSLIRMIASDPENGEFALDMLMIAKYFERIGDHAANIAEWVVFSVTGTHVNGEDA